MLRGQSGVGSSTASTPDPDAPSVDSVVAEWRVVRGSRWNTTGALACSSRTHIDFERFADLNEEICGMTVDQLLGVTPR